MSASSPPNGFRARLRRLARAAVAVAIALGGVSASAGTAAAADDDTDTGTTSVELFATAGSYGAVPADSAFSVALTVRNSTDAPLSTGYVSVDLGRTALTDSTAVAAWLSDGIMADDMVSLGSDATVETEPGGTTTTNLFIPADAIVGLAPGIYPLRASLAGATTGDDPETIVSHDLTVTSLLTIRGGSPLSVGMLVPITATPQNGALLTRDELTELTGPDGRLTAQLDAVQGTSAILAVDPSIPAAIRVLGASAPASATDWLARLETLPNDRFALQFGDADPAAQAHAELPELLGPGTLSAYLDPVDFPTTTPSPSPTPEPTAEPDLPDDDALTAISGTRDAILWPRGDVSAADLDVFTGYVGDDVLTILPSTSVHGAVGPHATVDGHELVITDATASTMASRAVAEDDPLRRDELLTATSALLHLSARDNPHDAVVLGLERNGARSADALRSAIRALITPGTGLSAIRAVDPADVTLDVVTDGERSAGLRTLLGDERTLADFATILDDPNVLLTPERIRILRTIAVGVSPAVFPDVLTQRREAIRATLGAVSIQQPSTIQLFASNAELPVWVRNDLPWPVTVHVSAHSYDLKLDVEPVTKAVVLASSNTKVKIPVSALVGSGEVRVRLDLSSPTGVQIGYPKVAQVQVRAEWENIGVAVIGGIAALLIIGGVIRTVIRKRRGTTGEEPHV